MDYPPHRHSRHAPAIDRYPKVALATIAILIVAMLGLFGRVLAYPLQHDEQIHVAAAALMSDYRLYQDLGYNHLPNLPLLLNALYRLTGTEYYILSGRILTCFWWIAACGALAMIAWRQTKDLAAVSVAVVLLLANVLYLGQAGMLVTNNLAPVPFALFGLYCFLRAQEGPLPRPLMAALAGFFLAIAIGFKVNYVFVVPPFALAALVVPRECSFLRRLTRSALPMLLGGVIGGLPTLFFLISDPQSFFGHTLRYFTTAHRAYWLTLDAPKTMTLAGKALIAESVWLSGTALLAICTASFLALLHVLPGQLAKPDHPLRQWPVVVTAGLVVTGALISFVPTPSFPQYFAPPIAFIIVLAVLLYGQLDGDGRKIAAPLLATVAILSVAGGVSRLLPGIHALFMPKKWEGVLVHEQARQMAATIGAASRRTRIATLSPIYPLEAGFAIYPEFAAGPFLYRVADLIPSADRRYFRTTSESGLPAFLDADPPTAIIVGDEGKLDLAFFDYARSRGYRATTPRGTSGQLRLFIQPHAAPVSRPPK